MNSYLIGSGKPLITNGGPQLKSETPTSGGTSRGLKPERTIGSSLTRIIHQKILNRSNKMHSPKTSLKYLFKPVESEAVSNMTGGSLIIRDDAILHIIKSKIVHIPIDQALSPQRAKEYIEALIHSAASLRGTIQLQGDIISELNSQLRTDLCWIYVTKGSPAEEAVKNLNQVLTGSPMEDMAHIIIGLKEHIGYHYTGDNGQEGFLVFPDCVAAIRL